MDEQNKQPNEADCYPLDDASIEVFAEGRKQIDIINAQLNGAFRLYVKQHKLQGNWKLSDSGKELERVPDTMPVQS